MTSKTSSEIVASYWQQAIKFKKALFNCCLTLMNGNATEAEDALQEALIHGSEKIPKQAGKITNFKAWLMRLTKNFCIDLIRKRSRRATGVDDIELVSALGGIDQYSAIETPVQMLASDEASAQIDEAITSLPEKLRSTYSLHYYDLLSNTEIADIQGITYDNVCQRISRAKKILSTKLRGYFCESEDPTGSQQTARTSLRLRSGTTKPTPPVSSAGRDRKAALTSNTSNKAPASSQVVAVVEAKRPYGENSPLEIEPEKISEEANLSSIQPVSTLGSISSPATNSPEEHEPKGEAVPWDRDKSPLQGETFRGDERDIKNNLDSQKATPLPKRDTLRDRENSATKMALFKEILVHLVGRTLASIGRSKTAAFQSALMELSPKLALFIPQIWGTTGTSSVPSISIVQVLIGSEPPEGTEPVPPFDSGSRATKPRCLEVFLEGSFYRELKRTAKKLIRQFLENTSLWESPCRLLLGSDSLRLVFGERRGPP